MSCLLHPPPIFTFFFAISPFPRFGVRFLSSELPKLFPLFGLCFEPPPYEDLLFLTTWICFSVLCSVWLTLFLPFHPRFFRNPTSSFFCFRFCLAWSFWLFFLFPCSPLSTGVQFHTLTPTYLVCRLLLSRPLWVHTCQVDEFFLSMPLGFCIVRYAVFEFSPASLRPHHLHLSCESPFFCYLSPDSLVFSFLVLKPFCPPLHFTLCLGHFALCRPCLFDPLFAISCFNFLPT